MKIMAVLCVGCLVAVVGCTRVIRVIEPTSSKGPVATPWEKHSADKLVPDGVQYVQVIITPGRPTGVQYGRVYTDGKYLVGYFRFSNNDAHKLVDEISALEQKRHFSYAVVFESNNPGYHASAGPGRTYRASPEFGFQPAGGATTTTAPSDPCTNAGSMPPTNPKGGESLPGSENDPQASAAYIANSVQGLVELNTCKAPPPPAPDQDPVPVPVK